MQDAVQYHATCLPAELVVRFAALCGRNRETALYVAQRSHSGGQPGGSSTGHPGGAPETRLWRFQHYADGAALQRDLLKHDVARLELGACYDVSPRLLRALALPPRATARDLVFDVDVDAYDAAPVWAARRCCRGAALCRRCWPLLACAAECLDVVLRRRLGFEHVLHVFSGRRGVHVWACDAIACTLSEGGRRVALHMVARAGAALEAAADFAGVDEAETDLSYIMRRHAIEFARRQLGCDGDGCLPNGGDDVMDAADAMDDNATDAEMRAAARGAPTPSFVAAAVLPRLDAAVTTQMAHLLRAPLVAHQGGGLALPLTLDALLAIDPAADGVHAGALCAALAPFGASAGADMRVAARFERACAVLRAFVERAEAAAH